MGKELLIETNIFTPLTGLRHNVVEGQRVGGLAVVEGVLATCEKKNGNGRYYRRELWERELEKYKELVENRRATGELDHPESSIINLKNVSHNIVKFWWDGDHILGQIEILPTPSGNILKALLEAKIQVGVSSRGMGSVKQIGETLEVQDDFELLCFDFVSNPSNAGSWMYPVGKQPLKESQNIIKNNTQVEELIREILCANGNCAL